MPFGKVADFLGELLPASAKTNANTVRNRMMRVGRRLERSVQKPETSEADVTVPKVIVGFDGGYVRARRGPERNFEVVVGKVLAGGDATRFAFVRQGSGPAGPRVQQAMVQAGYGMRWNRFTVQPFLTLRVHVLNATLEQAFSTWHAGFRSHVAA
jgi:hypothetical protein